MVNGYAFKSALYSNEGFSVIRIANVQKGYIDNSDRAYYPVPFEKEFKDSILQKGDILISLTGNVGRVGVITDKHLPAALNQRVQGLRLRKGIPMSNDFLFCVLNLDEFESLCIENASGSAQLNLSTIWVRNFQIICPPFDKQREFTQFANQADKSKFNGFKSRFFEQFSKPEITRVPLIDLCSLFIDGDWIEADWIEAKDQSDSGYRLVQTGNVGVCEYLDKKEHSRFVSEETFKRLNCTEIHSGDILFSRLPDPIGRCCIIPKDFPKAITAVDCTITRLKDNCLPEYLMIYTTTTMYSEQIKKCVTGTTRQRISRGNLAKITIPLPDKMKQVEFVNLVHQADKSKYLN